LSQIQKLVKAEQEPKQQSELNHLKLMMLKVSKKEPEVMHFFFQFQPNLMLNWQSIRYVMMPLLKATTSKADMVQFHILEI